MKDLIKKRIEESIKVKESLCKAELDNIEKAAGTIVKSLKAGGKLLVFGNGGSAADSEHIAAELVGRFKKERRGLAAIALTANTSIITAIANDYGYDVTFSRQIEALGKSGDVALGISTSGNSKNVIEAVKKAKAIGMKTISLTASGGGKLKNESDISIVVDSKDTPRIQESHILIGHILCELVEEEFVG
ncbi:MAG: D-sedoheptulose 7-phosphate isomerase [Candidatus Omnitrophica bacterium]|nr:D-sedoheptulose 7-phosphate isomerase [Candidatus Omnitrophota bacterium]